MNYHNHSTDQLFKMLDSFEKNTVAAIEKAAAVLVELENRRTYHPLMQSDVLRYYKEIDNGTISARAVLVLGIQPQRFNVIRSLPKHVQEELAHGKEFAMAEHNDAGEIVQKMTSYRRMSLWQLKMVFANGEVQPFAKQKIELAARTVQVRRSESAINIRADVEKGEIVCGQMRFTPHQLSSALTELGYSIQKVREDA